VETTQSQDRLAALEERLQLLEDQAAICRLIFTWGPAADTANSEAAASIWSEDAVLEVEGRRTEGRSNIFTMIGSEGQHSLVSQGCAHVHNFPLVKVDGDHAIAANYSRVYLHSDDGYGIWRVSANNWEFRRTGEGWRITRRTAHVIDGGPEARELLSHAVDGQGTGG
jgi:ketosteroid isomerase-like protein